MTVAVWTAIGKFLAAVAGYGASTYPAWAIFVARIAIVALASKALAPKVDLSRTAREKLITVRDPIHPQVAVYGQDMLSGPMFLGGTRGTDQKDVWLGVCLTGHEIDSFVSYRIDDTDVPFSDITGAGDTGVLNGGRFDGVAEVRAYTGTATQTVDAELSTAFGATWDTDHTGRGWGYMAWRFSLEKNNDAFSSGAPRNLKAVIKGKRVYDPRLDSTMVIDPTTSPVTYGSGAHRLADDTTWEWSDNSALCLADFYRWVKFGLQEDDTRIDWPLCAAAADICDEDVEVPPAASPANTQKRYTCNYTFRSTEQRRGVRDTILSSMLGRTVFSQGKWKMWAGAALTPDVTLTEANLAGEIQVQASAGAKERYNRVRGKYIDPDRDYQASSYVEQRSAAYESEDGDEVRSLPVDFPAVNNEYAAQRSAIITLKQSRQQRIVSFQGNYSCFRIQPGTTVSLDVAEYGFSGEKFFVSEWSMGERGVLLTMIEETDASWADPAVGEYSTRTATGALVFGSSTVPPPTSLAAATHDFGVAVTWTNPQDDMFDHIELHVADENVRGSAVLLATTKAEGWLDVASDIDNERFYWALAVNQFGTVSDWEPDLTTTTARAYPGRSAPRLVFDPYIRSSTAPTGSPYWETASGSQAEYVVGHGVDGTDVIRIQPDSLSRFFYAEPRLGPALFDYQPPGKVTIKVRWRAALHSTSGTWSDFLIARVRVCDGNDANVNTHGQRGQYLWDQSDSLDVWVEDSAIIEIDESAETPPRFIQVGLRAGANVLAPEWDIDYLDAELVGQAFEGAEKPGLVPDPGSEDDKYLKDDGTFDYPSGGTASASFKTQTVVDVDSGYSWAETGSAVADSSADTLEWVSGKNINIDVDAALDAIRITGIKWELTQAEDDAGLTEDDIDDSYEPGDLRRLATDDLDNLSASEISDVFGNTLATAGKVLTWDNSLVLADITITVGSGGHFTTINAALDVLKASTNQKAIELNLLTGFTMAEQVWVLQHDLSWITLTSVDAEVTITRSTLTDSIGGRFPAFHGRFHGVLPRISVLFNMDSSGTGTNRDGISVIDEARVEVLDTFGVKNAGGRGLYAASLGFALATGSVFTGAGQAGYRASNYGVINCRGGVATGCARGIECTSGHIIATDADVSGATGTDGILIEGGDVQFNSVSGTADASGAARHGVFLDGPGVLECAGADFSDATTHGIFALKTSRVTGDGVDVSAAGDRGVIADDGATVDVPNVIADSCTGEGLFAANGGTINARGGSATACAGGIEAQLDGRISADGLDASGSTAAFGVRCRLGSRLMFRNGNGQIGGSPASGDITCESGSVIYAGGATGDLSKAANALDSDGVIFN